jgi:calcium-dependent protein kinase
MHRDLKPENIMFMEINDLKSLKIVDFGLATPTESKPFQFPKCGTPGYVAPEIANLIDMKETYDKVCDVFSIGAIFYKLYIFNQFKIIE